MGEEELNLKEFLERLAEAQDLRLQSQRRRRRPHSPEQGRGDLSGGLYFFDHFSLSGSCCQAFAFLVNLGRSLRHRIVKLRCPQQRPERADGAGSLSRFDIHPSVAVPLNATL